MRCGLARTKDHHPAPTAARRPEQRKHSRSVFEKRIQILELDSGLLSKSMVVTAHDLSAGGLSFRSRSMLHTGSRLAILLSADGKFLVRVCRVTQCRYDQKLGTHVVGVEWLPTPAILPVRIKETPEGPTLTFSAGSKQNSGRAA